MTNNLHFYKFRAINKWTIESIVNNTISAPKPENLNDPFDCQVDLEDVFRRAIYATSGSQLNFIKSLAENKDFLKKWNDEISSKGIYSFSLAHTNVLLEPLMWSHYADEHRGVCLEYILPGNFITSESMNSNEDEKNDISAQGCVEYKENELINSVINAQQDYEALIRILLEKYLLTKSPSWSYEKEARLVFKKSGAIKIPREALYRIHFGIRASASDIELIKKLAKNYSDCNSFHKIKKGVGDYALESEEIFY